MYIIQLCSHIYIYMFVKNHRPTSGTLASFTDMPWLNFFGKHIILIHYILYCIIEIKTLPGQEDRIHL